MTHTSFNQNTDIKNDLVDILHRIETHVNDDNDLDMVSEMHVDDAYDILDQASSVKTNNDWTEQATQSISVLKIILSNLEENAARFEKIDELEDA